MTSRPGRNLSVAGFGVDSVCMNMALSTCSSLEPFQSITWTLGRSGSRAAEKSLEIRGYSFLLPISVARRVWPFLPTDLLWTRGRRFDLAARVRFRFCAFAGLADAGRDFRLCRLLGV